jgi:hypothetical protein
LIKFGACSVVSTLRSAAILRVYPNLLPIENQKEVWFFPGENLPYTQKGEIDGSGLKVEALSLESARYKNFHQHSILSNEVTGSYIESTKKRLK